MGCGGMGMRCGVLECGEGRGSRGVLEDGRGGRGEGRGFGAREGVAGSGDGVTCCERSHGTGWFRYETAMIAHSVVAAGNYGG